MPISTTTARPDRGRRTSAVQRPRPGGRTRRTAIRPAPPARRRGSAIEIGAAEAGACSLGLPVRFVDAGHVTAQVLDDLAAVRPDLALERRLGENLPRVLAHPGLLRALVRALLAGAAAAAGEGSARVAVETEVVPGPVRGVRFVRLRVVARTDGGAVDAACVPAPWRNRLAWLAGQHGRPVILEPLPDGGLGFTLDLDTL